MKETDFSDKKLQKWEGRQTTKTSIGKQRDIRG